MVKIINPEVLNKAISEIIREYTNEKVRKYFIGRNEAEFAARVKKFANTLCVLIARGDNASIECDGDVYDVTDYKVTASMQELINAKKVYFANGTEDCCEPLYNFKVDDETYGNILSPAKFNGFISNWMDYSDLEGVSSNSMTRSKSVYLENFEAFVNDEGDLVLFKGNTGTVKAQVSQILDISVPGFPSEALKVYRPYTERSLGKWLFTSKS